MSTSPEAAYSTDGGFKQLVLSGNLGHASESILPDRDGGRVDDRRWLNLLLFKNLSRSDRSTLRPSSQTRIGRRRLDSGVLHEG
jgi:hypothetical protein